ncbi:hypothetical protein LTR78_007738 [Recurvomyces mirabilis]|uniref:Heterokaryon incompatibility domain-containing protein n=1 Tax=Recurvomyces mirabilis TaxID=574656 RepID=A0AAE0TRE0_9PEZI|nr:hypothetical protein LTR78_007738 [Recurvomyces mirabilis]KAK5151626.1 hypothetical protein LTS14_009113 [Recurvomyces mirabilis]
MSHWTDDSLPVQCSSPVADIDSSGGEHTDMDSDSDDNDWPDTVWADEPTTESTIRNAEVPERKLTAFYPSPPHGLKPQETRLLRLLPGEFDSPIRCSLSIQSLADGPTYEALSYTWGNTTKDNAILVNEYYMQVTDNLLAALRYIRRRDQVRILWVDAICMNQHSIAERNHQVAFMNEIYRTAARVLIWLGEGMDVTDEQPSLYSVLSDPATWAKQHHINRSFQSATRNTIPSWWKRAWTVQEYVVASSTPVICFRAYAVSLEDAEKITRLRQHDTSGFFSRIDELAHLAKMHKDRGVDLLEAVRLTADCQALDMRDKVYSVLGLLKPSQVGLLKPDYSMPTGEVYALATKICLQSADSFALFPVPRLYQGMSHIEAISSDNPSSVMVPSWAMNFADDAARLRRSLSELEQATSFAKQDLPPPHDNFEGMRKQDGLSTPSLVLHRYIYQVGKVSNMIPAGGAASRYAPLVGMLAQKMAELFRRNIEGTSAMTELHDDLALRHSVTYQGEWRQAIGMMRESFRQANYPYDQVGVGSALVRALEWTTGGKASLLDGLEQYIESAQTLGVSGAILLGYAMRRRIFEHCFRGWQDQECIQWLRLRDMGAPKLEGNGALFCTNQSHFGVAEAVVEKGDVIALSIPDMKTILLKPHRGFFYRTVRYQYKGFV